MVVAFDPAEVPTPDGVTRLVHPALAVADAGLVLALTAACDAPLALLQALEAIGGDALYVDLSTGSPQMKRELAGHAAQRDLDFADAALMAMVPGTGLATPTLVSGHGAERYCSMINPLGGRADPLDGPAGAAAARKLLRSVMMKGTAAVLIEALRAGAAADDLDWLWANLSGEIEAADEQWLFRLVTGSKTHAGRRKAEMEAVAAMLDDLGQPAVMTRATIESLTELLDGDAPDLTGLSASDPTGLSASDLTGLSASERDEPVPATDEDAVGVAGDRTLARDGPSSPAHSDPDPDPDPDPGADSDLAPDLELEPDAGADQVDDD